MKISGVIKKILGSTFNNRERHEPGSVAAQLAEKISLFEKTVNKAKSKDLRFAGFVNLKKEVREQAAELKELFKDDKRKVKAVDRVLREFDFDVIHWDNLDRDLGKLYEK